MTLLTSNNTIRITSTIKCTKIVDLQLDLIQDDIENYKNSIYNRLIESGRDSKQLSVYLNELTRPSKTFFKASKTSQILLAYRT
jgi:phage regulator Rha-like protein